MLKKIVLGVTLISAFALPASALPKSMTMTTIMTTKAGSRNIKATAKIWYLNGKLRSEVNSNVKMMNGNTASPVKINNKAVIIVDTKKQMAFMINAADKIAMKVNMAQVQKLSGSSGGGANFMDPTLFTNSAKMKAELKKQGAKQIGKATLLGRKCTIWEIKKSNVKVPSKKGSLKENVRLKLWISDAVAIPLKAEVYSNKRGLVASLKTTKLNVNVPINSSLFKVPAGYKVTNLMDMFKTPGK